MQLRCTSEDGEEDEEVQREGVTERERCRERKVELQ